MKQAVILAAGEGQRLRPFTVTRPKVMLAIAGKPILQYVVEALAHNGIRDIIIVVGYRREQVYDYMVTGKQFGVEITYVTQERQLGTAHALALAKDAVKDEFLLLPGDNLIEPETIKQFAKCDFNAVLVKSVESSSRYGVVAVEKGCVKNIQEKPTDGSGNLINTGIYAFNKEIFECVESQLDIPDMINSMVAGGRKIAAVETDGTWMDVVYPWDMIKLNDTVIRQIPSIQGGTIEAGAYLKGVVSVGKGSIIRSNSYIIGPVVIGENCDIGPNVVLMPSSSIGANVVISPFSHIENCVIGDDVNIGPGAIIQDSVIDKGCVIKGHFSASSGAADVRISEECHQVNVGAMLGVNCNIGNNVTAAPGVIAGNYTQVAAMKLISGRLPERSLVV